MIKILNLKWVIMSEYKNIKTFLLKDIVQIAKGYSPNSSKEVIVIKEVKNTVPWTYLKGEEITGTFYEKKLQKTNEQGIRIEKFIIRKENKLYVKWKRYDNSFNSWIDKMILYKNESILP